MPCSRFSRRRVEEKRLLKNRCSSDNTVSSRVILRSHAPIKHAGALRVRVITTGYAVDGYAFGKPS